MEKQTHYGQPKKTVHISWNEAQRAEAERESIRRARYKPVQTPSLLQIIAARMSKDLPKLKATALRIVSAKSQ
jgi:hypothetical protein